MCTQKPPHDYSEDLYLRYKESFVKYITEKVCVADSWWLPCIAGWQASAQLWGAAAVCSAREPLCWPQLGQAHSQPAAGACAVLGPDGPPAQSCSS